MSNNSRLLVPMYMEALVLKQEINSLDISAQLPAEGQVKILGESIQPPVKDSTLEAGVHLHWTLPKALKHSFVDDGQATEFPFVPNRWLVTRIQTDTGITAMPARIWMLESDAKNDDQSASNFVSVTDAVAGNSPGQQFEFLHLGKSTELLAGDQTRFTGFALQGPAVPLLKAVVPGNPNFASFYPGCRNLFGFYDALDDINTDCTLNYIVTGWYTDPKADPLQVPSGNANLGNERLEKEQRSSGWFQRQWKQPVSGVEKSSQSLLHASVNSVRWNARDAQPAVPAGSVNLYTGNTSMEALSVALAQHKNLKGSPAEELMNALQFELLEDELHLPGLSSINSQVHKRGFSQKDGGSIWEIGQKESTDQHLEDQQEKRAPFPNDRSLLQQLKNLNKEQAELNKLVLEIASLQQEYYFLWYKNALKTTDQIAVNFDFVSARNEVAGQINTKLSQAKPSAYFSSLKNDILRHPALAGDKAAYELKQKPEDRYWEPNEPVLLLSGAGMGNSRRPDPEANNGVVQCRTGEQVVAELPLKITIGNADVDATVPATQISVPKVDGLTDNDPLWLQIRKLVYEALLLDPSLSADIALLAFAKAGIDAGKTRDSDFTKDFADTKVKPAQAAQLIIAGKNQPAPGGVTGPEAYAVMEWKQAWSPVFMIWEVFYAPANLNGDPELPEIEKNWNLENGLLFKNKSSDVSKWQVNPIKGTTPLSATAIDNLNRILPQELVDGLQYERNNLISQAISGFHRALLLQKAQIQLPPFEYTTGPAPAPVATDYRVDQQELATIGNAGYRLGTNPGQADGRDQNLFYPLRAGFMRIEKLSLVDAFGQEKKVVEDGVPGKIAFPSSAGGAQLPAENIVPLPPRVLQPSRLVVQWLNVQEEIVYQDAGELDNPVFGWLVPNYLDNSIMIYDGEGKEVVLLQISMNISRTNGLELRKTPFPGTKAVPDLSSSNPHLQQFLDGITEAAIPAALLDLAAKINLNIVGTNAVQINTTSLLCGQPIALARCRLSFELMGMPALNQRWDKSGTNDDGGINALQLHLSVGDYQQEKDGLLGFFIGKDYRSFYTTANAPDFDTGTAAAYFKANTPVTISAAQPPRELTLLLDPCAGVHISSGILPTKFVELFHHQSKALLSSLDISFMLAPFIGAKLSPGIPVPASLDAKWKWTSRQDVNTFTEPQDIAEGKNKQRSSFEKLQIYEGWLKLSNLKNK